MSNDQMIIQEMIAVLQDVTNHIHGQRYVVVTNKEKQTANERYIVDALKSFTESYLRIRDNIKQHYADENAIRQRAFEQGKQAGFDFVVNQEYISVETLRHMSVQELANLLANDTH